MKAIKFSSYKNTCSMTILSGSFAGFCCWRASSLTAKRIYGDAFAGVVHTARPGASNAGPVVRGLASIADAGKTLS